MKPIYIKRKTRRKEEFQFFMHDFIDDCIEYGFLPKRDLFPSYKWYVRAVLRNVWWLCYSFFHNQSPRVLKRREALVVAANGNNLVDNSFPYWGSYEIVPFLWDCWPSSWPRMLESFRMLDVSTVMVSSSQVADMINTTTDIKVCWIPEGIRSSLYSKGRTLAERRHDVFELGRQHPRYHQALLKLKSDGLVNDLLTSNITATGALDDKNVAYTNEEMRALMSDSKVMVCFPQSDTNPNRAGGIETLTQRYWEAMLSRCVMVGRAPKELVDLIGYNPVIDVDWDKPEEQMQEILSGIEWYQEMVERNLESALKYADWSGRLPVITEFLNGHGYKR